MVRPGISLNEIHISSVHLMTFLLQQLHGFEQVNANVIRNIYLLFNEIKLNQVVFNELFPHHIGHYLGMDLHDTPSIDRSRPLQPGMVITIEPGIYLPGKSKLTPQRYSGIAMRIEDDILITEKGFVNLTEGCPKQIHEIETIKTFR